MINEKTIYFALGIYGCDICGCEFASNDSMSKVKYIITDILTPISMTLCIECARRGFVIKKKGANRG
jgi:hypothetical protein